MPGPDFLRSFQASTVLFSFRSNLEFFYSASLIYPAHIRTLIPPFILCQAGPSSSYLLPANTITDISTSDF